MNEESVEVRGHKRTHQKTKIFKLLLFNIIYYKRAANYKSLFSGAKYLLEY